MNNPGGINTYHVNDRLSNLAMLDNGEETLRQLSRNITTWETAHPSVHFETEEQVRTLLNGFGLPEEYYQKETRPEEGSREDNLLRFAYQLVGDRKRYEVWHTKHSREVQEGTLPPNETPKEPINFARIQINYRLKEIRKSKEGQQSPPVIIEGSLRNPES